MLLVEQLQGHCIANNCICSITTACDVVCGKLV
nr:MAG TPA: hypothetical protein [Caudoviricetes sp.]